MAGSALSGWLADSALLEVFKPQCDFLLAVASGTLDIAELCAVNETRWKLP